MRNAEGRRRQGLPHVGGRVSAPAGCSVREETDQSDAACCLDEVIVQPPGTGWAGIVRERWRAHGLRDRSARFREQLGLPADSPIIATGHQPTMWHAGILAKYFAADSAARRTGAQVVWLVADQDTVDPFEIRLPARSMDGALARATWRLGDQPAPAGVAAAMIPATDARTPAPTSIATDGALVGAERIARVYRNHRGARSAAEQAGLATADLLTDLGLRGTLLWATDLQSTDLFRDLLAQMRSDPARLTRTYNAAAAQRPGAGVTPLICDEVNCRFELPLWRLRPGAPRERVYEEDLDAIAPQELAPRALLMTALLRMAGCELFIHGTGGAEYDLVTEAWIRAWLGVELAPAALATATLLMPFDDAAPTPGEVDHAVWMAHHAGHDPGALGLADLAERKTELVRRIQSLRDSGADPAPAYREMQEFLREYRGSHQRRLEALDADADALRRLAGQREVATDRTWPFALHDASALKALREAIDRRFG